VKAQCEALLKQGPATESFVKAWALDVCHEGFYAELSARLKEFSRLDFVYVNAGAGAAGSFVKLNVEDFRRNMEVNFFAAINTIKACLPILEKTKGRIVTIASLNSYWFLPLGSPYNASKAALKALSLTLEIELATLGVGVTTVYPGPIRTEIVARSNKGEFRPEAQAAFADKPALDPSLAALRIVRGVLAGRSSFSTSVPASFMIWLRLHFEKSTQWLLRVVYKKFEAKFKELVGLVNPDSV
jgi:NAD(P)-dependent dehydrogenase (short-subunit alcohol dehydrogenase family)